MFCPNYKSTLSDFDLIRYETKIKTCSLDPYNLTEEECSKDVNLWPKITEVDRLDYFVYRLKFSSLESMKCLKANDAHNFVTSGHVRFPIVKEVSAELVVSLASVKHSQSSSLPPLKVWLLAKKDGVIVCGHCTCMAGLGETCSHIGALVFLIEYSMKRINGVACTDAINKWLPPCLKTVPFNRVQDMDFRSSDSRLTALVNGPEPATVGGDRVCDLVREPAKEANNLFLASQSKLLPKSSILSSYLEYCEPFVPQEISRNLPKDLSTLYDPTAVGMQYEDLLNKCSNLVGIYEVTPQEIIRCEEVTRKQSKSGIWPKLRVGRCSASIMKLVCVGNVDKPAISTINSICYVGKEINTCAVKRGKQLEPLARKLFAKIHAAEHPGSSVTECGLFISQDYPFIAASPDGIVRCCCCDGVSGLEIKTTSEENLFSTYDADGQLEKTHRNYYQIQTQILVCSFKYVDYFVYTGKNYTIQRIYPDFALHEEIVTKSQEYCRLVIMPELVAKHFSLNGNTDVSNLLRDTTKLDTAICTCRAPKAGKTLACSGSSCLVKEFHMRCVGITSKPRKKWYCDPCKV